MLKVNCIHGYFLFQEVVSGELSKFMSLYGLELVPVGTQFTFKALEGAPHYSFKGSTYLGAESSTNYQGAPWEVMEANSLVFNFTTGKVQKISSVTSTIELSQAGAYFVSRGLILPGSITKDGSKIKSYRGFYDRRIGQFQYSEVSIV